MKNVATRIETETGQEPTVEELASASGKTEEKIRFLQSIDITMLSLDTPMENEEQTTIGAFIEDPNAINPFEEVELNEEKRVLRRALAKLPARDQDILRRRYGIDRSQQTLELVASHLNLTKERVRQLEVKAMERLLAEIRKITEPKKTRTLSKDDIRDARWTIWEASWAKQKEAV